MITRNHRQESLSRAYVQAVAAQAGLICSVPNLDYGIDLSLREVDEIDGFVDAGTILDIQLKATTLTSASDPKTIGFDLRVLEYEQLRREDWQVPRILVVLELPLDEVEWLSQTPVELTLRRAAYWLSLSGLPATENTSRVRVKIPRVNLFTPAAASELMIRVRTGRLL